MATPKNETATPKAKKKTFKDVHEALHHIQQNLNAPKDLYNKFGKYSYRSAEGILNAVKPLLEETGATLKITDEVKEAGSMVYCEAKAVLIFKGEVEESKSQAGIPESKKTRPSRRR